MLTLKVSLSVLTWLNSSPTYIRTLSASPQSHFWSSESQDQTERWLRVRDPSSRTLFCWSFLADTAPARVMLATALVYPVHGFVLWIKHLTVFTPYFTLEIGIPSLWRLDNKEEVHVPANLNPDQSLLWPVLTTQSKVKSNSVHLTCCHVRLDTDGFNICPMEWKLNPLKSPTHR